MAPQLFLGLKRMAKKLLTTPTKNEVLPKIKKTLPKDARPKVQRPQANVRMTENGPAPLPEECGIYVIRNAFNKDDVAQLLENLKLHRERALLSLAGDSTIDFDPSLQFKSSTMAANLVALDPLTKNAIVPHASETSLFQAFKTGPAWDKISQIINYEADISGARVRVIHPEAGRRDDRKGAVFLHQEKWVIGDGALPRGHNIWVLLNTDGKIANKTTSGLQFVLGDANFWKNDNPEVTRASFQPKLNRLNNLSISAPDNGEEVSSIDGQHFYRPHLEFGDIVIFTHHVPHGSFVPVGTETVRTSCEFRVYPKKEFKLATRSGAKEVSMSM